MALFRRHHVPGNGHACGNVGKSSYNIGRPCQPKKTHQLLQVRIFKKCKTTECTANTRGTLVRLLASSILTRITLSVPDQCSSVCSVHSVVKKFTGYKQNPYQSLVPGRRAIRYCLQSAGFGQRFLPQQNLLHRSARFAQKPLMRFDR